MSTTESDRSPEPAVDEVSGGSSGDGRRDRDVALYEEVGAEWWSGETRWLRTLANMTPARLRFFDPIVEQTFGGWRGRDVLDLGCGGGFMAEALDDREARVAGLDPAAAAIEAARAHAASGGRRIDYRVGVGESLPFEDKRFDAVVCVDVLEHVEDLGRVLGEVARVLRPGGLFLFDTIDRTALASFVVVTAGERLLGLLPRGTHDPKKFIRPQELRDGLEAEGFAVGRLRGLGPVGINRKLDFTFGVTPITAIIYIGSARLNERAHVRVA